MGTKISTTYAKLVLGFVKEKKMYETVKMENDENFAKYIKEQWKRFSNDCFHILGNIYD